jgi:hypothetical protein
MTDARHPITHQTATTHSTRPGDVSGEILDAKNATGPLTSDHALATKRDGLSGMLLNQAADAALLGRLAHGGNANPRRSVN